MHNGISKSGLVVIVAVLLALLVSGCAPKAPPLEEEKVIKVGIFGDLAGPYAVVGVGIFQGQYDYLRYVNDEGGIDGVKFEILWVDDRSIPAVVLTSYRRFKEQEIKCILLNSSTEATALMPYLEADKIPAVGTAAAYNLFEPPGWYYAGYLAMFQSLAASFKWWYETEWPKQGLSRPVRVACLVMDNALGRGAIEGCIAWAKKHIGIEVVCELYTAATTMDYTIPLTTIKAADPDIVILSFPTMEGLVFRDANKVDFPKDVPFNVEPITTFAPGNLNICGPGAISQAFGASTYNLLTEDTPGVKLTHEIHSRYRGETVTDWMYFTTVTSMILVQAIERALDEVGYDNLTGSAIKEYGLDTLDNWDTGGLSAPISYSDYPNDRIACEAGRIIRYDWDKRQCVAVSDWFKFPPFVEFREVMR